VKIHALVEGRRESGTTDGLVLVGIALGILS
jgi:hypothetical protein